MNPSLIIQSQLLATKFFVPAASHTLIARPRLTALLQASLRYPLTLVSAPAGFGKTMLLSTWVQLQPTTGPVIAWVSLDEEDNDPRLFWTYILSALSSQRPERFSALFKYLQSPQTPPLKYILASLSNLLLDSDEHVVLILDDYHVITEKEVHTSLAYFTDHVIPQFHIILATRTDPSSLPLSLSRARGRMLEVRTDQLRCTPEETRDFFATAMDVQFPDETIEEVTARTEGWLVGLQLLGLSLPESADPLKLLAGATGNQRYILDYLTEEVLRHQPPEVQTFLLSTSILERLTAPLCDAVMGQHGSQRLLEQLERSNLFIVSLDNKRSWYRYHALFAEALRYRLEQTDPDQIKLLHYRASRWYAEHQQTTAAILHGFQANQWSWVADLIEQKLLLLMSQLWGANPRELIVFRQWLERLPAEVVRSRPRLCLACALLLWQIAPQSVVEGWLDRAEAMITTLDPETLVPQALPGQEDLLGEEIAWRAFLQCHVGDGEAALLLCEKALSLLSPENKVVRAIVNWTRFRASYISSANNAAIAIESGLQAGPLAQSAGQTTLAIVTMGSTAGYMVGAGRLREMQQLVRRAIFLGTQEDGMKLPVTGYAALFQAENLREWNRLDEALTLALASTEQCKQVLSMSHLVHLLQCHAILLRIYLSRGELAAASAELQEIEQMGRSMNPHLYLHIRSLFTTVDQVRLWLACGELERARHWAENLDLAGRPGTPFERERESVAHARILLAREQPILALQQLEPTLQRATTAQRWGHVIEILLLKSIAYQMQKGKKFCYIGEKRGQKDASPQPLHGAALAGPYPTALKRALPPQIGGSEGQGDESNFSDQAKGSSLSRELIALAEAVRLAEPEGYIRIFLDEGPTMEKLLFHLQKEQRKTGPTPYLDTILAAFPKSTRARKQR